MKSITFRGKTMSKNESFNLDDYSGIIGIGIDVISLIFGLFLG